MTFVLSAIQFAATSCSVGVRVSDQVTEVHHAGLKLTCESAE